MTNAISRPASQAKVGELTMRGTLLRRRGAGTMLAMYMLAPAIALALEPWNVTVTPTMNPLPVGVCAAISVTVLDASTKDVPRNARGTRVTIADFDIVVAAPDGTSAVAQQIDSYHWSACACQGAAPGSSATVTATYPAKALAASARVPGVSFQKTATFTVGAAKGRANPPACTAPKIDPFAAAASPGSARPVTTTASPNSPVAAGGLTASPVRTAALPAAPASSGVPAPPRATYTSSSAATASSSNVPTSPAAAPAGPSAPPPPFPTTPAQWAALQESMGGSGWAKLMKAVHDSLNDSPDDPEVEAPPGSPAFLARRNHGMAAAAFKDMLPVLRHPRCINCHSDMTFFDQPASEIWDSKTSTTYMEPAVAATHPGGALDLITPTPENDSGMTDCRDCHIYAPRQWETGPTWVGLDDYNLCQKMKDSKFNGEMFIEHIRDDALIKLAFVGRRAMDESPQPPPMSHGQFLSGVRQWINYMDAMKKYPRSRSEGCPRSDQWRGAIEYTYTETKPHDRFESHGMVHVFDGRVRWNGLATLREDHSAKGCPSVKSANAIGSGDATFVVLDVTSETPLRGITMPMPAMPGAGGKAKVPRDDGKTPAKMPLLLTVLQDQYGIVIDLDLIGSSRYYGGGPACPGFRPNEAPFAALIQETMNGKFDPDNPDELSGTKSTTPFPGASLTLKWKLERLDEYR